MFDPYNDNGFMQLKMCPLITLIDRKICFYNITYQYVMTRMPEFMTTATDDITITTETAAIVIGVIDVISDVTDSLVWFRIPPIVVAIDIGLMDDVMCDVTVLLSVLFKNVSVIVT